MNNIRVGLRPLRPGNSEINPAFRSSKQLIPGGSKHIVSVLLSLVLLGVVFSL